MSPTAASTSTTTPTQKQLWVIRHAKTANPPGTRDYDRPLTERGYRDARLITAALARHARTPKLLVTSAALRARTTAELLGHGLGIDIVTREALYGASVETLLDTVQSLPEDTECVGIVAHNPGISYLAAALADGGNVEPLPTLGTVGLAFTGTWIEAGFGRFTLNARLIPKSLR